MADEGGIDWAELDRRWDQGQIEYDILHSQRGGQKGARALSHPLDRYKKAGTIDDRQYIAGQKLYQYFRQAMGNSGGARYDGTVPPDHYGPRSISDYQIDASRECTNALRQVGKRASIVLKDMILHELTAEQHGRRLGISRWAAVAQLTMSLDMLADHFKLPRC